MGAPYISSNLITAGASSGSTETFIELTNGCFSRQIGATNWNRIRLAMRYRMYDHPSYIGSGRFNISPNFSMYFGFSNGTGSVAGDIAPTHFWGIQPAEGSTANSSVSGVGTYYNMTNTYLNGYKWQNGTETSLGNITAGNQFYMQASTSSCDALMFDLTRNISGSDVCNLTAFFRFTPTAGGEYYSTANFLSDIQATVPVHTNFTQQSIATAFALSESVYGPLNAVNISWGRDHPRLQIVDLYVVRLA